MNRPWTAWPASRSHSQEVPICGRRDHTATTSHVRCHGGLQSQAHPARLSHLPCGAQGGTPWRPYPRASPAGQPQGAHALTHLPFPWQPQPGWEADPGRGAGPLALRQSSQRAAQGQAPTRSRPEGPHTAGSTQGRPDPRRPPPRCSAPPNSSAVSKPPQPQPPLPPPGRRRAGQAGPGLTPQAAPTAQERDGEGRAEAGAEAEATGASAVQPLRELPAPGLGGSGGVGGQRNLARSRCAEVRCCPRATPTNVRSGVLCSWPSAGATGGLGPGDPGEGGGARLLLRSALASQHRSHK